MKTLVLGVGNPILSDDSAGLRVAQALKGRFDERQVTVLETSRSWFDIVDMFPGHERVIIIDAIQMREQKIGEVCRLSPENLEAGAYCISPHNVNLAGALKAAKRLGMALPSEIVIFAIGVGDVTTLSEDCAPQVKRAIEVAVEMVTRELEHAYSKN